MPRTPPRAPRLDLLALVALLVVWAASLAHAAQYRSFLSDDALISLRYARRLTEGLGLTWTGHERVEGYTDLLWVLLTAAGGWLGLGFITCARALDHMGVLLAVAVVGISPLTGRLSAGRLLVGGGLLAASVPMAVWANAGLEHGFMTGVLAVGLFLLIRSLELPQRPHPWWIGLPFAALTLLRADGVLLACLALTGALLAELPRGARRAARDLAPAALSPIGALIGQLAFRRVYYGQWQPNTAAAKVAFNLDRLTLGLRYLGQGYLAIGVLLALAVWASVWRRGRGRRAGLAVAWTLVAGWSIYLAAVGGDIFPGWRQLVFVLVPLAWIVADGAERVAEEGRPRGRVVIVALAAAALVHARVQRDDAENVRARKEVWERDGFSIGSLLKRAFGARQPLHAVDAAGALPYWSELPSLDMLGLMDSYLAHHRPPSFGHGGIGHELGDGAYVLGRRPDLISFNNAGGHHTPGFLSGRELLAMPEFHRLYQWIRVQGDLGNRAIAEIWVRREDGGKLGIRRSADRIDVPGYFLTGQESDAVACLDEIGRLTARASWTVPGVLPAFEVPAGRWRVTVDSPTADLVVDVRCGGRSMQRQADSGQMLELDQASLIGVALSTQTEQRPASIAALVFVRDDSDTPARHCAGPHERLVVTENEVAGTGSENLFWAHPSNIVMGPGGVSVTVTRPRWARVIEISVDNNDVYQVALIRKSRTLWTGQVTPRANGGGLAVTRLWLMADTQLQAGDRVEVTPAAGDGAFSLGRLRFLDSNQATRWAQWQGEENKPEVDGQP